MRPVPSLGIASGVLLFWVLTYVNGYMAAIAIPPGFFAFFGKERLGLGLFFVHLGLHAIPSALIAMAWYLLVVRLRFDNPIRMAALCLVGYLAAVGLLCANSMLEFAFMPIAGKVPLLVYARQLLFPSWWAVSGALAVPFGW